MDKEIQSLGSIVIGNASDGRYYDQAFEKAYKNQDQSKLTWQDLHDHAITTRRTVGASGR